MSLVNQNDVDACIEKYKGASKRELLDNLKRLQAKSQTSSVQAEIKTIIFLLI